MPFGGELTSIRVQSVGEDRAGLQLAEKLAKPLLAPKVQPGRERGVSRRASVTFLSLVPVPFRFRLYSH